MSLIVHRAPRADQLVDGLAELLRTPLDDPFAQELVLVPARGVERWLSQRLSHRLGHAEGRDDGVCAGVEFRSPASLVAEVTGTREHDPWSPDALVWPLLTVVDASAGEAWARTLSPHLGHGQEGEEGELRRGRRYAVARRLARLFGRTPCSARPCSPTGSGTTTPTGPVARCRPTSPGSPSSGAGWSPRSGSRRPASGTSRVVEALRRGAGAEDLPPRLSLFGHTRIAVTEVELLAALGEHRDVHLWLPHPSAALWDSLVGTSGAVPRRADDSHQRGRPPPALLARPRPARAPAHVEHQWFRDSRFAPSSTTGGQHPGHPGGCGAFPGG